jgi:hypothetical protein
MGAWVLINALWYKITGHQMQSITIRWMISDERLNIQPPALFPRFLPQMALGLNAGHFLQSNLVRSEKINQLSGGYGHVRNTEFKLEFGR